MARVHNEIETIYEKFIENAERKSSVTKLWIMTPSRPKRPELAAQISERYKRPIQSLTNLIKR